MTRYKSIDRTFRYVAKGACLPASLTAMKPKTRMAVWSDLARPVKSRAPGPRETKSQENQPPPTWEQTHESKNKDGGPIWPGP